MFFFFFLFFCQLYPEYRGISSKNYFKDHRIANFRPLKYTAVINFQFKKVSVNKNLHYLNITKVFKYKLNIKISLDGSNPIIILLNCKVLCLKPRKVSSFYFFFTLEIPVVLGFPCGRAQLGNPYLNATLTGISSGALAIFTNHVNPLTVNFFFHSTIFVSRKDLHF